MARISGDTPCGWMYYLSFIELDDIEKNSIFRGVEKIQMGMELGEWGFRSIVHPNVAAQ